MSYNPAENSILLTTRVPAQPDTSIYDLYTIPKDAGESASSQQTPDGKMCFHRTVTITRKPSQVLITNRVHILSISRNR